MLTHLDIDLKESCSSKTNTSTEIAIRKRKDWLLMTLIKSIRATNQDDCFFFSKMVTEIFMQNPNLKVKYRVCNEEGNMLGF